MRIAVYQLSSTGIEPRVAQLFVDSFLAELRKRIDASTFSTWCVHLQFVPSGADRYQVPLPNEIYRQWVERRFRAPLDAPQASAGSFLSISGQSTWTGPVRRTPPILSA